MDYDLIVIGGGAAGNGTAHSASEMGKSVALIERDTLGGTCTNYGCDPTKALLHVAKLLHEGKRFADYGLQAENLVANWQLVQHRLRALIASLVDGPMEKLQADYAQKGIDLILGEGRFVDPHTIAVGEREISAENILIATGAEPLIPPIDGIETVGYITNKTAPYLDHLPTSLLVVGAGPVGVEFAQTFSRFGVTVTLVESSPHILPKDDAEVVEHLAQLLTDEGIDLLTGAKVAAVTNVNGLKQATVQFESGYEQNVVVEEILLAAGRRPALDNIAIDKAGVALTDEGWIAADDTLQTNVPHIWAAGDITASEKFTHVASQQGPFVAENIFAAQPKPFDRDPIPWVTYTSPELAHVGQTEAQLRASGADYRAITLPIEDVARSELVRQTAGIIKLLVGSDNRLVGGHILAPAASDMLGTLVLAMRLNAAIDDLATLTLPYPSWVEGLKWAAAQH